MFSGVTPASNDAKVIFVFSTGSTTSRFFSTVSRTRLPFLTLACCANALGIRKARLFPHCWIMVCITYLQRDYSIYLRRQPSSAQRTRIAHIALVEIHVFLGQIAGIHHRVGFAKVEINVQIKFLRRNGGAKLLERRLRRLAALQA